MSRYTVEIVQKAEKEFLKLPEHKRASIIKKILSLENIPRPFGAKKLKETEFYRIRVGNFRVIYSINDGGKTIKVLSIGDRKEVYR